MRIDVHNQCPDFNGYRAARVKSLFNAERGNEFKASFDIPVDDDDWKIGLVVGPSGSGKTSIGRKILGPDALTDLYGGWPGDTPIVEAIAPDGDFNAVTGALASVGLGDVPSWLRPFHALSNGQQFRAGLARAVCQAEGDIVIDEFTSVVDRQIAKIGAQAFAKAWRRSGGGRVVLLACHYDIIEWLQPDWVLDTASGEVKKKPRSGQGRTSNLTFSRSTPVTGSTLSSITT
jgi:ABC-type lipoprotein export system ATPase subunit